MRTSFMSRKWVWSAVASLAGTAAVVIALSYRPQTGNSAEPDKETKPRQDLEVKADQPARAEPASTGGTHQLPIGQVVPFGTGAGSFHRQAPSTRPTPL